MTMEPDNVGDAHRLHDVATVLGPVNWQLAQGRSLFISGGRGAIQRELQRVGAQYSLRAPGGQTIHITWDTITRLRSRTLELGHKVRVLQIHGCNDGPRFQDKKQLRPSNSQHFAGLNTLINFSWLRDQIVRLWSDKTQN